jgi:hypothetical protein
MELGQILASLALEVFESLVQLFNLLGVLVSLPCYETCPLHLEKVAIKRSLTLLEIGPPLFIGHPFGSIIGSRQGAYRLRWGAG